MLTELQIAVHQRRIAARQAAYMQRIQARQSHADERRVAAEAKRERKRAARRKDEQAMKFVPESYGTSRSD